jgi:L-fuculose-phosphate aldolase
MINWALTNEMVSIGKRLYERQLIVATEGNFTFRIDKDRILTTPSGLCKGELKTDDLVLINIHGKHLSGKNKVSSEIALHLEVYKQRQDVKACIHAHPANCIALMLSGKKLDKPILPESVILLGKIPTAPYARPSTSQVPESIRTFIKQTDCILLDRHGSLTVGNSLHEAFYKIELMEHTAKCYLKALSIGEVNELDRAEINTLMELRKNRYKINNPIIPFD